MIHKLAPYIAVIQAGGLGTRMRELTDDEIPKPMLPLNGKPMIEWQIEAVRQYGITDLVLIIGHLGNQIKTYFKDGSRWGVRINYIEETEPLGSAGALYYLKDYPAENYLLIFGDVMFDMDIKRLFLFHHEKEAGITLVAHPNSHPFDSDLLVTDSEDRVTKIMGKKAERPLFYQNLVNSGLSLFRTEILKCISEPCRTDWERDVVNTHLDTGKVYAYRTSEYIKDVGTPSRFKKAGEEQKQGVWEIRNLSKKQKCVFLDRDGTINKLVGLVSRPEQLDLYDGVSEAIRMLNSSGYLTIVATNQPVVARGMCSEETVREINRKLETLLGQEGAYLDDIVFCPHHPDKGFPEENPVYKIKCECRKPQIGMIRKMENRYNINLSDSFFIGDTTRDVQTGANAGMHTILLLSGEAGKDGRYNIDPDYIKKDLLSAVKMILKKEDD